MRTLHRDKKIIYVCHKKEPTGKITTYHEPIKLHEFYATTDNEADLISMGMDYVRRLRIKTGDRTLVNGEWVDTKTLYHAGDRVYVYVEPPEEHDELCQTADFEVEIDPVITPNQASIILLKLSGKNNRRA